MKIHERPCQYIVGYAKDNNYSILYNPHFICGEREIASLLLYKELLKEAVHFEPVKPFTDEMFKLVLSQDCPVILGSIIKIESNIQNITSYVFGSNLAIRRSVLNFIYVENPLVPFLSLKYEEIEGDNK